MTYSAAAPAAAIAALLLATPAAAADVGGPRVEAVIGYEAATLDDFGPRDNVRENGMIYGIGVGYDLPLGPNVALGADLEASDSDTNWHEVSALANSDLGISLGRDLYAGGRLTVGVSDGASLYLKAGYTSLSTRLDFTSPTFSEVIESDEDGVRGGVGLQVAVAGNAYVSAEYRYSVYDGELSRHQGVAGLGFRF